MSSTDAPCAGLVSALPDASPGVSAADTRPHEGPPRVVLIGGGVHATVVVDCIRAGGAARVVGYCDAPAHDGAHMQRLGVPFWGDELELVRGLAAGRFDAAILGIAGLEHARLRQKLVALLDQRIRRWQTAVHPHATLAESARVEPGAVVLARAVVNPLACVGQHAVVNTAAVVEHHARVEDFAVVSPNATLCGRVHVGRGAFVGAGAVVLTDRVVGAGSVVGAGAIVIRDVPDGAVVVGNPARILERRNPDTASALSVAPT